MNELSQNTTSGPKMWRVFDMNAVQVDQKTGEFRPRIHEVRPGVRYPLRSDRPVEMPEGDARIFLKDEAFVVEDERGNRVLPLRLETLAREVPKRLDPEFVIAAVSDLSTEALVTRAAQFPGGQMFDTDSPRPSLIRFLISAQRARDATNTASDDAPEGRHLKPEERLPQDREPNPEQMSPEQLAESFG